MLDLTKDIEDSTLAFLDIETTGLSILDGDSICEIAVFKTEKRKIIDTFKSLINPQRNISKEAYKLHKLSNKDLENAPTFKDIVDTFISFINKSVICAYSASFDIGFINNQLYKINYSPIQLPTIDIVYMARKAVNLSKYNLEYIANFFNIKYNGLLHRAVTDAYLAYKVFFRLTDILKEKNICKLKDYIYFFGLPN